MLWACATPAWPAMPIRGLAAEEAADRQRSFAKLKTMPGLDFGENLGPRGIVVF